MANISSSGRMQDSVCGWRVGFYCGVAMAVEDERVGFYCENCKQPVEVQPQCENCRVALDWSALTSWLEWP